MNMRSTRRLEYFVVLAEHLHFARAADALGISQPALSAEIRKLETETGSPLFTRAPRTSLTREGDQLLRDARAVISSLERFNDRAREVSEGLAGSVVIGFVPSFLYRGLPEVVRRFVRERPHVRVRLVEYETSIQGELLLTGEIDIACGNMPLLDSGLESIAASEEPFYLCVPSSSTAGGLHDMDAAEFVLFRRSASPYYHDRVLSICALAGIRPDVRHETATWESVMELVGHQLGSALVPASVAGRYHADGRLRLISLDDATVLSQAWISRRLSDDTIVADMHGALLAEAAHPSAGESPIVAHESPIAP